MHVQHACRRIGGHGQAAEPGELGGHSRVGAGRCQHLVWAGEGEGWVGHLQQILYAVIGRLKALFT